MTIVRSTKLVFVGRYLDTYSIQRGFGIKVDPALKKTSCIDTDFPSRPQVSLLHLKRLPLENVKIGIYLMTFSTFSTSNSGHLRLVWL